MAIMIRFKAKTIKSNLNLAKSTISNYNLANSALMFLVRVKPLYQNNKSIRYKTSLVM